MIGPKDDYTVQAKIMGENGNVISESAVQTVKAKHGILDIILFFFAYIIKLVMTTVWYLEDIR